MSGRHIVVLGGGVAGLSTAAHLAESGEVRVTLVEREPRHDLHSSGRSAEIQRIAIDDPVTRALALETAARMRAGEAHAALEPRRLFVTTRQAAPAWREELERAGELTLVAPDRMEDVHPVGEYAFLFERAGRIAAGPLLGSLAERARRAGTRMLPSTPGAQLAVEGDRVRGVQLLDGSRMAADAVVIAAGAWSSSLGAAHGAALPLRPTTRHLVRLECAAIPAPDAPMVWDDASDTYMRPDGDGWILSICDTRDSDPGNVDSAYRVDAAIERLCLARLERFAPGRSADAVVARAWTGFRDLAPDDRPVLGPDARLAGLYWCAGLGGHGMTLSLAIGAHAAGAVLGCPSELARACGVERLLP